MNAGLTLNTPFAITARHVSSKTYVELPIVLFELKALHHSLWLCATHAQ